MTPYQPEFPTQRTLRKAMPPELPVLPVKRFNGLTDKLLEIGVPAADARAWSYAQVPYDIPRMVELVLKWREVAVDTLSAIRYCEMGGWNPREAEEWQRAGFRPEQAAFASLQILKNQLARDDGMVSTADDERAWLRSGTTPGWVCLVLAAGHTTVNDAERLYAQQATDSSIRGTLHLLADLKGVRDIRELMAS